MAIITKARMQQLRGKYNRLNKEAMLPGEIAICDDHNPIVRTNTGYKEILTKDNAEYFEEKVADINNAISSANEAVNNANQAINDMGTATTENTQKIDNAIAQLETDKEQKFEELDTNVANTVSNAVSDLNTAKEQAISDMETATDDNTQRVNNALQQITTKIGIDDTTSSTMTTYSSDKIDKLIEAVGGGGLSIEIVESLPTSDIKEKTLYLVPSTISETNNVYDEYIYIDGSWEIIGSTAVDLTNYYKKNEVDTLLGNKVTKEEGKGLFSGSYNDLEDVPTNLATLSDLEKYLKANDNASFYFGVLNHKFGYYTTEAREESDFHEFGSSGFHVPPKDVYNVSIKASDGALTVSWNDPDDTFIEGVDISHWAGTILVMKADTAPVDENDGTVVLTNTVRNQYATEGYVINGLTNNTTYHLYFIPYNQEGDYEYSDNNRYTGMPAKVMLDDVTNISTSSADGSITVNWTNPSQVKEQDGITATWVKTTVVVKADSQPTSATDGTAYESTVYSENSHTFTLENGKDYYVGFFIESDLGSVTHTTYDTATSLYATVTVSTEETTLIGKTVTATYGEDGSVSGAIGSMGFVQLKIPYIGEVTFSATDGSETATSKITIESFIPMSVSLSFYAEWCYSMHIGSDSDPDAAVTYVGDNANFTPAKMKYDTDTFDWGSWADAPFIPRPCMLKSDGTVDYYLNPNDYALKEDGTSSDIGNTSYDGNAMVEWGDGVRPIYLTIVPDTDITQATIHISNYAVDDTSTCYPFMDSNGSIIKHFYTPCYAGSLINNKLRSISGQVVMQSKTAEQEMTYAQANGDGYNIELTCDRILINFLLLLMAKTLNTENAYGKGNQSGYVNNASSNYGMHNTGTMNSKGLFWGKNVSSASDTSGVKVFGMEDWWGNQWRRMAGLITIAGKIYIKLTHSTADGSTTTGYNTTGSGYISTGLSCSGTNGGFINKVTYNPKYAIPTVSSGSETTYYADGLWFNASDTRFALVGGTCTYGSHCGAFCLDLSALASRAVWYFGAALSCKPLASEA